MQAVFCLSLLLASISAALAQEGPQLTIKPTAGVIRRDLGSDGFFTCQVDKKHETLVDDVTWLDPSGKEVPDERTARVSSDDTSTGRGRELFISDLNEDDAGNYTCLARLGNQEITKTFTLLVYMSIRWEDAPEKQYPVSGSRALIKCVVKARPPAIVEWFYKNQPIRKGDRYSMQDDGLVIENISAEDEGVYVCRAKVPDEGEIDERPIRVEVHSRPEITEPPAGTVVRVTEGESGSIRCLVTGKPTPAVSWLSPAGEDAGLVDGLVVEPSEGRLTFQPAERRMAGQYRCVAENAIDAVETTVQVEVMVKPEIVSYENVTAREGETASLTCAVTGSPLPDVSFRRVDSETRYEEDYSEDDRVTVQQRQEGDQKIGVLSVRGVTRADAGGYECVAVNRADGRPVGQALAVAALAVQFAPALTGPEDGEVFTWTGRAANLTCAVRAAPRAEVTWTFAGASAEQDPQIAQAADGDVSVLTVTPTEARYYDVYTCTATNELGSESLDITLREATAPGPVTGVAVQDHTSTSLAFYVPEPAEDGGLPVVAYRVEYVPRGEPWDARQEAVWPAQGPFTLERLTPDQRYVFRFAAESEVGVGPWSEELEFTMPTIAPPELPVILTEGPEADPVGDGTDTIILSEHPDSYTLRWEPGPDNGAPIENYMVSFYKIINNKNIWRVVSDKRSSVVEAPGPLTFRLTDLKPESYYRVEVSAWNRIGRGEPAQLIIHTAKGVAQAASKPAALASSLVIGVVAAVLLVLLVLCDLTCYAVNNRGITHMLCAKARGSSGAAKLNDEAASEKEPLQENGNGNKSAPESNGERDVPEVAIDKAQLDAAKDSPV